MSVKIENGFNYQSLLPILKSNLRRFIRTYDVSNGAAKEYLKYSINYIIFLPI
jgi:hypothetical protein